MQNKNPKYSSDLYFISKQYAQFPLCHHNSVRLSSVTLVHPTQRVEIFCNIFSTI